MLVFPSFLGLGLEDCHVATFKLLLSGSGSRASPDYWMTT